MFKKIGSTQELRFERSAENAPATERAHVLFAGLEEPHRVIVSGIA